MHDLACLLIPQEIFARGHLGGCPRIESLLRKSHFGPFLRSFSLNMSNYAQSVPQTTCHGAGPSPQMIEKMTAKWLSLATTSILGQPPSPHFSPAFSVCSDTSDRNAASRCIALPRSVGPPERRIGTPHRAASLQSYYDGAMAHPA